MAKGLGLGLALLATALSSHAQGAQARPDPAAVAALQCLQRTVPAPRFEEREPDMARRAAGFLRVLLTFTSAVQPPEVEILASVSSDSMRDKANHYLSGYRLPCHTAALGPVRAVQEFHFDTLATPEGDPLKYVGAGGAPTDYCIVTGKDDDATFGRLSSRHAFNRLATITFAGGPTDPPSVELSGNSPESMDSGIRLAVNEYRMPCRKPGDAPVVVQRLFKFVPPGGKTRGFKDKTVALTSLLPAFKNLEDKPVYFDLGTMACPFRLDFELMRPLTENIVREVGPSDLNRTALLEWLGTMEMDLPPTATNEMIGARVIIDVPCGVIDLRKDKPAT